MKPKKVFLKRNEKFGVVTIMRGFMESGTKNIIIAASGTGGHIYPGIALALELKNEGFNPVFFVSSNEACAQIMKRSGFEYVLFNLSGMPRRVTPVFIIFLIKLAASFFKALYGILKLKPFAVVGMGGYVSVPAILAAWVLRKKTYIHEQNAIPGKANKILNGFAGATFISFKYSAKFFKKQNIVLSGYPVRREIFDVSKELACRELGIKRGIFTILVFGGSLGAAKLNETAFKAFYQQAQKGDVQILHIAGAKNYSKMKDAAKDVNNYKVFSYMHDMKYVYGASDAVICRSGAGTVFELKALNKPAVLIPYPYAAENHQLYNAKELSGALIIEEKDLTPEKLNAAARSLKQLRPVSDIENRHAVLPQEIMAKLIKDSRGKD
ncbi:MAG: undecaprenyldiphospho-muramoylpentapeptide beta-N-acetylglucosaminyltransferase [Endomicrobium sp.]|jgi:UDP-N-acetylglucosamine--N-acetylmuramyl-(pentapeptide) pyrophosphoryl-undecaprenol N-acetylglucosamine transferase|nr:undecaprenyldiphospho-muramoylpentapeptide beta-N-acetylglucosaminyltransferase [Endomicrobium sp.]